MRLYEDIKSIFKKDMKLFLAINAIYFGAIIVGALIAVAYPDLQMSMIRSAGETFGGEGPLGSVGSAYLSGNVFMAAILTFLVNLLLGTLISITIPSLIIPFWALIFGVYRALLWGVMLIVPVPGVLPLSSLAPHYITLLLEGEAYVIAMFACTRGLLALIKPQSFGTDSRLKAYWKSIIDNGKLLLLVAALLAVAATYEAWEVTFFAGIATGASSGAQLGFYDDEFGKDSSYSNWTQVIPVNTTQWHSFNIKGDKHAKLHLNTNDTPLDILVLDNGNFSKFKNNPEGSGWSAMVHETGVVNKTFDFNTAESGNYWIVLKNTGTEDSKIWIKFRYAL